MSPAYYDGQQASVGGVTMLGNPYCPITQEFSCREWLKGWSAAEYERRHAKAPKHEVRKCRPIIW